MIIFEKKYNALPVIVRLTDKSNKEQELLLKDQVVEVFIKRESNDETDFYIWSYSSSKGERRGLVSSISDFNVFLQGESAPSLKVYLSEDGKLIIKERG